MTLVLSAFWLLAGILLACALVGGATWLWPRLVPQVPEPPTVTVDSPRRHRKRAARTPVVAELVDEHVPDGAVGDGPSYPAPLEPVPASVDPTVTSEFRIVADAALRARATASRWSLR